MIKLTTLQIRKLAEFAGLTVHVDPELTNDEYCIGDLGNTTIVIRTAIDEIGNEITTLEK